MKPGTRPPRFSASRWAVTLTAHWGATPCIKIVPHQWLGTSILRGAVPVLKPIGRLQVCCRVLTEPSRELGYAFPIALVANAEPVMRASYVNDSNYLRERAAEMRSSSKELKDNNTAAVIMRLADLYDRLADRAETRGDRAVRSDRAQPKEDGPPTRS